MTLTGHFLYDFQIQFKILCRLTYDMVLEFPCIKKPQMTLTSNDLELE